MKVETYCWNFATKICKRKKTKDVTMFDEESKQLVGVAGVAGVGFVVKAVE